MNVDNLPIHINDVYAKGPPKRKLVLRCTVTNPSSYDICILDVWIDVTAIHGLEILEGRLFESMHCRSYPAIIETGKEGSGVIHIDLPVYVLQHIEEHRAGGDVKFQFRSRVLISEVLKVDALTSSEGGDVKTLGVPFETTFVGYNTDRFEHMIPQSVWIQLLRNLAWSELEIVELPSSRLRSVPPLKRALNRFEEAQECHRRGDWEAAMSNCRKTFEAIVYDATDQSDMRQADQVFADLIGEGEKANRISKVAKSINDYLHLGRHENLPDILINRPDSQLALFLTGALLKYLGEQ